MSLFRAIVALALVLAVAIAAFILLGDKAGRFGSLCTGVCPIVLGLLVRSSWISASHAVGDHEDQDEEEG